MVNETRNQTYKRLSSLAASSIGVNESDFYDLLKISDKAGDDGSLNSGNQVTNDLKVLVKVNRQVGIHVTPTVVFNGVVENSIASSFSAEDWEKVCSAL
jgi:protein-disulfide isomerase